MSKKRKVRKTITMVVAVTVPHWATVGQARSAVRDYLNSTNNWWLQGPNYEEGVLRTKSVRPFKAEA